MRPFATVLLALVFAGLASGVMARTGDPDRTRQREALAHAVAIRNAWMTPHPACAIGMSRLSCVFCIMAARADLRTADLERRIGHTLSPSGVPLPELAGISPAAGHDDPTGLSRA